MMETNNHGPSRGLFVTSLGTFTYKSRGFELPDGSELVTPFSPAAALALGPRPDAAVCICSPEAWEANGDMALDEVDRVYPELELLHREVEVEDVEKLFISQLGIIREELAVHAKRGGSPDLWLDVTLGFRPQPVLMLLAIQAMVAEGTVASSRITYTAFERGCTDGGRVIDFSEHAGMRSIAAPGAAGKPTDDVATLNNWMARTANLRISPSGPKGSDFLGASA